MTDRAQWLEERRKGLGGTDIAAILGLSPWKSALQVYQEKRGELAHWEGNAATDWGKRMEPAIRQWYSDSTGRAVRVPEGILFSAEHPFMLASLDGFTDDGRIVEIKTARSGRDWGEPGTSEIPEHYCLQVHHYMIVTGFEVADVVVSIGGGSPVLYEVPADPELHEMIIQAETEFWARVQEGRPPEPVTYSDVVRVFGRSAAQGVVVAPSEAIGAVGDLRHIRDEIEALKAKEEDLKAAVIKALGDAGDELVGPGGETLCTYRLAKGRATFDAKRFVADFPQLSTEYLKEAEPVRRFILK